MAIPRPNAVRRFTAVVAAVAVAISPLVVDAMAEKTASDDAAIVHAWNRLAFGPRPGDVERVRQQGLSAWIDAQLKPERIADAPMEGRLAGYATLNMSSREIAEQYLLPLIERRQQRRRDAAAQPGMSEQPAPPRAEPGELRRQQEVLQQMIAQKILRAVYSERQLQEVLTDFWFNHFNVFANKGFTRLYLTSYERDAIRPHVLGRFRDLLGATAKSPAMLFYLDNVRSADPSFADKAKKDLDRAQRAGGRRRAGNQRPAVDPAMVEQVRQNVPTGINENYARELLELHTLGVDGGYTQQDIVNVARALTGWTIGRPRSPQAGQFWFNPRMHDSGDKRVLGQKIDAGGIDDGERVLDLLARHPATAKFISTKLVRRFIADEPPASLVDRATATFKSTDGDLRAVLRVILTSTEFLSPEARRAKVKTPFEFVVSALRATGADVETTQTLGRSLQQQGMPLYLCQPPTGYKDTADAWVNTGALISRMNFAVDLANGRMAGVQVGEAMQRAGEDAHAAIAALLHGNASETTAATIEKATMPAQVVALALGSPEFQRR